MDEVTNLYLVRHGRSVIDEKLPDGSSRNKRQKPSSELGDDGRLDAAFASSSLPTSLDFIYSSPLARAYQTAKIISSKRGSLTVMTLDSLKEIERPEEFYGAPYSDSEHQRYMKERKIALKDHNMAWSFNDKSESNLNLKTRVIQTNHWIETEKFTGKSLCLVGHSQFFAMQIPILTLGEDVDTYQLLEVFTRSFLRYGGIAHLVFSEKKWILKSIDRNEHFQSPRK